MATPKVWRTKDGKEIPIRDLEDTHLVHATNMLLRIARSVIRDAAMKSYCAPLQGEMAQYYAESDARRLEDAAETIQGIVEELGETQQLFKAMLAEVRRRKLDLEDPEKPGQFVVPAKPAAEL